MEAQFAPVTAIVADDFDGDGRTDLLLAGNEFGIPPLFGRYDASYGLLLHGDGQYAPEYLPQILVALADDEVDAVIASRMMNRFDALRGHMPLYKWVGNQILTTIENRMLGSDLSEFHSGYRAYKVDALRAIPFQLNSDDFHFDTEIIVQLVMKNLRICELPIPTYYGDEICHVNGMKYAWDVFRTMLRAKFHEMNLLFARLGQRVLQRRRIAARDPQIAARAQINRLA